MDAAEFATFMVAEDAGEIVAAFNKLHGNARATFVAHLQVIASMSAPVEKPVDRRILLAAAPEVRTKLFQKGVFFSETPEGRVVERKARGHKLPDIAKAEFPELDAVSAIARVRAILAASREDVAAERQQFVVNRPKKAAVKMGKRRPSASIAPLKARAIELRKLGISTGQIAKAIGEAPFFVTRALAQAQSDGTKLPVVDEKATVPPEMMGRHTIPGLAA